MVSCCAEGELNTKAEEHESDRADATGSKAARAPPKTRYAPLRGYLAR